MFSSENKPLSVSDFLVYGQRRKPLASEQLHLATFVHDKHCRIPHTLLPSWAAANISYC